ncbi:unnamed protein product, partial [Didymodactylos carnosus]
MLVRAAISSRKLTWVAETETTPNGLADQFNQTLSDSLDLPVKRPKSNANEEQASDKEDIDDDDDNIQMTYSKVATTSKVTHEQGRVEW